ncbi:AsnC family transcriptional regulator [Roseibium salinum]|uniref:siroheme decarboxylase n=1 Tax=Roseibium salinum TaxID=1604349 RepID=A0ABT3R6D0_9HYPH|nr:AsnC family transcriptional regulator [Roseibium sp. DSM 29163]MCX2724660.1 AsnC family transcriptional regulator [Roseibium sp. DSM 29163]MDN3721354.1 AsnC family transcriptional regulator [Roseibium salinum]
MDRAIDPLDLKLLDRWQRDLPLVPRPFAEIGALAGCPEQVVIRRLMSLLEAGKITRVGATCAPNTVSASTLAAVSAPDEAVEAVAEIIGNEPGINHSYLREHHWNLWFVATGPDRDHVSRALERIRAQTGLEVLDLPIVRPFNIDLGFRLNAEAGRSPAPRRPVRLERLQEGDNDLLQALTTGLPICERPYAQLAAKLGRSETEILERIADLHGAGIISRLGVIVRHRALGWRSNAMVVWDIAPERIGAAGPALAAHPGVTLCYERRPVEGVWPYRLYAMIHATSRQMAQDILADAARLPELENAAHHTLFSTRCFKQTGAMISHQVTLSSQGRRQDAPAF